MIRLSGSTTITTAATLEARILFTPSYNSSGDLFREWANGQEDKHFLVGPSTLTGYFFNIPTTANWSGASMSLNAWHHVAWVYDGSTESLYFDGSRVASQAASGTIANAGGPAFFGGCGVCTDYSPNSFIGYMDWFRMSNSVRYSGTSYTVPSGQPANDANTQLLFYFDEASGSSTAADQSSFGHTGTLGVGYSSATSPQFAADPLGTPTPAVPALSELALVVCALALAAAAALTMQGRRRARTS